MVAEDRASQPCPRGGGKRADQEPDLRGRAGDAQQRPRRVVRSLSLLPIALTDDEVKNLQAIAKTVPWQDRNAFVHRFEQLLALRKEPGPAYVWRAAHFAAREALVSGGRPMSAYPSDSGL